MTDPITCPECQGAKGERLGPLALACRFCQGRGWVGGDFEPAELPPPPAGPPPAWEHRVWQDAIIATGLACRYCLGFGQVTHLDDAARTVVSAACPICTC